MTTSAPAAAAELPEGTAVLDTLRKTHPRVMLTNDDVARIKTLAKTDANVQRWIDQLHKRGQAVLEERPTIHELRDGVRLLFESRETLDRAWTLGLLHQLTGDTKWRDRAWQDAKAIAAFPDWNPAHFLDTAEMTFAMAVYYDWLYDAWSDEQRKTIREAIVKLGLNVGLEHYRTGGWWTQATHNWNQVCNGGLSMGALAIADEEPDLAAAILHEAIPRVPASMKHYQPDGGYEEGPTYWHYGTRYNVYLIAGLVSALGNDFKLSEQPAFDRTALFPIHMTGPTNRFFNFADAGDKPGAMPQMFWLARRYNLPIAAHFHLARAKGHALDLLWYDPDTTAKPVQTQPLDSYFRHVETATFRSAWDDENALFLAIKGGSNHFNHSNLDLGSFVFDALGQRWAIDLGKDDYNLPGYFERRPDGRRWSYYRMRAESHNTLVITPGSSPTAPGSSPKPDLRSAEGPGFPAPGSDEKLSPGVPASAGTSPDQDPHAAASILGFRSTPDAVEATVDLTDAYRHHGSESVRRRVIVLDRRRVLMQDSLVAAEGKSVDVWWFMHTPAAIKLEDDDRTAVLTLAGRTLRLRVLSPEDARFSITAAAPLPTSPNPEGQVKQDDIRRLAVHLKGIADTTLSVRFEPQWDADSPGTAPSTSDDQQPVRP